MKTLVGIAVSMLATKLLKSHSELKVDVVHAIPGRIRLKCDRWKNHETATLLEETFNKHPLVRNTKATPITGSLLISFHVDHLTEAQFDEIMKLAVQATVQSFPRVEASLMQKMKGAVRGIDDTIKTRSMGKLDLNSTLILFLTAKGLMGLKRHPFFSSSLLLWSYGLLNREGKQR